MFISNKFDFIPGMIYVGRGLLPITLSIPKSSVVLQVPRILLMVLAVCKRQDFLFGIMCFLPTGSYISISVNQLRYIFLLVSKDINSHNATIIIGMNFTGRMLQIIFISNFKRFSFFFFCIPSSFLTGIMHRSVSNFAFQYL